MAIVKIKFKDKENDSEFVMLFGDSYKTWREQYQEYLRIYDGRIQPLSAWKSRAKWKGFGGLKWCAESEFQNELNREDVQDGEPDNPNPRQYSRMTFEQFAI